MSKKEEKSITEEFKVSGDAVVAKVKELLREGNIRRIVIKNEEGKTLIEIPLTVGVVGTVLLPVWAALGAIAALVANLTIAVERRSLETAGAVKETAKKTVRSAKSTVEGAVPHRHHRHRHHRRHQQSVKSTAEEAVPGTVKSTAKQMKKLGGSVADRVRKSTEDVAGKTAEVAPQGDDLKAIKGVGPKLESLLKEQGISSYRQIAELSDEAAAELSEKLNFPGRIARENWQEQARALLQERRMDFDDSLPL